MWQYLIYNSHYLWKSSLSSSRTLECSRTCYIVNLYNYVGRISSHANVALPFKRSCFFYTKSPFSSLINTKLCPNSANASTITKSKRKQSWKQSWTRQFLLHSGHGKCDFWGPSTWTQLRHNLCWQVSVRSERKFSRQTGHSRSFPLVFEVIA